MADVIQIPLGKEARLYYGQPNKDQTCAQQAVAMQAAGYDIGGVRDLTVGLEKEDTDVFRRRCHGWTDTRESVKDLSLTFDIVQAYDLLGVEEIAWKVLMATFLNGTYNGLQDVSGICLYAKSCAEALVINEPGPQALDGDGMCADFLITKFERVEASSEPQVYNVEAKMTQIHARWPMWI